MGGQGTAHEDGDGGVDRRATSFRPGVWAACPGGSGSLMAAQEPSHCPEDRRQGDRNSTHTAERQARLELMGVGPGVEAALQESLSATLKGRTEEGHV